MIKIFEENSYIKEFESIITKIDEENNFIELEKTAFYAKSGGQPGDTGVLITKLEKIDVIETLKKEGEILHKVK